MALIPCPECQTTISTTAKFCPRCDFDCFESHRDKREHELMRAQQMSAAQKRKAWLIKIVLAMLMFLVIGGMAGCMCSTVIAHLR